MRDQGPSGTGPSARIKGSILRAFPARLLRVARRAPRTTTLLSTCLLLGALLTGCGEDDDEQQGWLLVSAAVAACRQGECAILPAWHATVEVIRLSDGDTRVLELERDGTARVQLPAGTYRVRMGFPDLAIAPEAVPPSFEMRNGITRDVMHVFQHLSGDGAPRG